MKSLLAQFPISGRLPFFYHWSREGDKNGIALVRAMDMSAAITLGRV
jgi:hypothetical protein